VQSYIKTSEEQKKSLFFFSFPSTINFGASQSYIKNLKGFSLIAVDNVSFSVAILYYRNIRFKV